MTPEKKEIVWRFIKHLNRLGAIECYYAVKAAKRAIDPESSPASQEDAMITVAQLIGEYEP